jgi:putative transposon-encoded protein
MDFKIKGKEILEKEVTAHGNGAKVLIPKKYLGKKVMVVIV